MLSQKDTQDELSMADEKGLSIVDVPFAGLAVRSIDVESFREEVADQLLA